MNKELPRKIQNYLERYAFDKWNMHGVEKLFKTIVVIPAIEEFQNIKSLLLSLSKNDNNYFPSTLILFVINNKKNSEQIIKNNNKNSIEYLNKIIDQDINYDNSIQNIVQSNLQVSYINASSNGFELNEKEGGVGLARKIGMDEALKYFDHEADSKNILICLDADCTVSKNYISEIRNKFEVDNLSAAYVNFSHPKPKDEEEYMAIINYEIFLRYYVLGLKYANSTYAYHSVGSTMVCDVDSYIKVQGMNKRKAAEDFYFMEKLSKITEIKKIEGTTVYPSSRGSWRVPFGTGKRVSRFLAKEQNEYMLYNPVSFEILKKWNELFLSKEILSSKEYLNNAIKINNTLFNFLTEQKFETNWNKILMNTKSPEQINIQKRLWFDGFKTLKLIHFLRDEEFSLTNMFDAVDELFERMKIQFDQKNVKDQIPSVPIQEEYILKLREIA